MKANGRPDMVDFKSVRTEFRLEMAVLGLIGLIFGFSDLKRLISGLRRKGLIFCLRGLSSSQEWEWADS